MNTKYLRMNWTKARRSDRRRFKARHNRRVSSIYVQIGSLEVVVWYR